MRGVHPARGFASTTWTSPACHDLESDGGHGFSPAVEAFRAKVHDADCFPSASPEYNYSITSTYFTSAAELGGCWVLQPPYSYETEHP